MRRLVSVVLLFVSIISLLTACWDAREIDEWSYVYIVGVDKGVGDALRFTFQLPSLKHEGAGAGGQLGATSQYTTSIDAPTM